MATDTNAERMTRMMRVSQAQLRVLTNYSRQRTRELVADGIAKREAVRRATDETAQVARSLGMAGVR